MTGLPEYRQGLALAVLVIACATTGCRGAGQMGLQQPPVPARPDTAVVLPPPFIAISGGIRLDVSATGTLYVLRSDPPGLLVFRPDGQLIATWGGAGTGAGALGSPVALDAGTGLVVAVSEAGNGRIQRFSQDGALVELIPVSSSTEPIRPRFNRTDDLGASGSGRPGSLTETADGSLYVIEEVSARVMVMDRTRENIRFLAADVLQEPAGLAPMGSDIVVVDAVGLHRFNALGTRIAWVPSAGYTHLAPMPGGLIGIRKDGVVLMGDRLVPEWSVQINGVRDVRVVQGKLLVLTTDGVHRVPLPALPSLQGG